jgi:hypothetical protein
MKYIALDAYDTGAYISDVAITYDAGHIVGESLGISKVKDASWL